MAKTLPALVTCQTPTLPGEKIFIFIFFILMDLLLKVSEKGADYLLWNYIFGKEIPRVPYLPNTKMAR